MGFHIDLFSFGIPFIFHCNIPLFYNFFFFGHGRGIRHTNVPNEEDSPSIYLEGPC